ncbi:hypothetical protein PIB30_084595 [Stylosanthes scabra]|uniref:Uncharacterized protein n=1 Tax=Stylosanthes scabra TaxID=79078 RepID=A0ABU6QSU4_9FABA|nr:hypothetical protein [Stylosanthes scabra]
MEGFEPWLESSSLSLGLIWISSTHDSGLGDLDELIQLAVSDGMFDGIFQVVTVLSFVSVSLVVASGSVFPMVIPGVVYLPLTRGNRMGLGIFRGCYHPINLLLVDEFSGDDLHFFSSPDRLGL